jgi:RNA recognition motif-containing protein
MVSIYVGNLSFQATDEDLSRAFGEYGEVAAVRIVKDRATGRSHGFAFVDMPDEAAALRAVAALHNHELAGRPIRVSETRPREDRIRIPA